MRSHSFIPLLLAAATTTLTAQVSWPTFQGNARHDGFQPVMITPSSLVQRWEVTLGPGPVNQVAVADSKVFASGPDKTVFAIDSSTGTEVWRQTYATAFSVNPPAYANGRVYVQTGNHASDTWLRCLDASSGVQLFQSPHTAQWDRYLAPTIANGNVYVNGGFNSGMYGFDGTTGQQLWFVNSLPQYDAWTPAVENNVAYAYVGGALYAHDATNGSLLYSINDAGFSWVGWSMELAPVLGGQSDAFIVHSGRLVRFDLVTHGIAYALPGGFSGQPAIRTGVVYALAGSSLHAIDQATGLELWSWTHPSQLLRGTVAVTNSHVIVQSDTDTYLIDLQTHQSAWNVARTGQVTVGEGAFYVGTPNGILTCFGFAALPNAVAIAPTRMHYAGPSVQATITGSGFTAGTNLQVLFDDHLATGVTIVNDNTLTCVVPECGPGLIDVQVVNSIGQHTMVRAFAYTPAVHTSGNLVPGGSILVSCFQDPGEVIFAAYGHTEIAVAAPPWIGELQVWPPTLLFVIPGWPYPRFDLPMPIPASPSVSGVQIVFQSLVGPDIMHGAATFSNASKVVIQ